MPLQDLTPTLRTRLTRLEFLVGLFVSVAALLMLVGLGYYIYERAERKGWILRKMPYFTFVHNAAGLHVGDKVKLMGFDAGEILEITPEAPGEYYDVYVRFQIWEPYYGYLWDDSRARVAPADLLGKRSIEVTKGAGGVPTYLFNDFDSVSIKTAAALAQQGHVAFGQDVSNDEGLVARACRPLFLDQLQEIAALGTNTIQVIYQNRQRKLPTGIWNKAAGRFVPFTEDTKGYFLLPDESPALTERLETVVNLVQDNLPNVLELTNQLTRLLTTATRAVDRAQTVLAAAEPVATNLAFITANLRAPQGGLGDWLLPTNLNTRLTQTLVSAQATLEAANTLATNTDARVDRLVTQLGRSLEHLADLTSNLNAQVQSNSNLVTSLNQAIIQTDQFIQGLKKHWLLRSAFRSEKTQATNRPPKRFRSPRDSSR